VPIDGQRMILSRGVDIIVGTPGRVLDLLDRSLRLDAITAVVLDEADRMLDMGFAEDVQKIIDAIPAMRTFSGADGGAAGGAGAAARGAKGVQTVLFSATIPPWVRDVAKK
jgi:superfamily II DNA/RNA helicase